MATLKKKICLIGSFAVGKTSLIQRYVYDRFDEKYLTTIGVKISEKALPPITDPDGGQVIQHTFLIWDIAGLEKFDSVVANYFRGAAGALIVADLTRHETIEQLGQLYDRFSAISPDASVIVLGNKLDIFKEDKQTVSSLKAKAAEFKSESILTSAKTGDGVEQAFMRLSQKIGCFND
ncbi:MAG: GTP-binding protein [Deltaproteobacteria bacterium]|nr:GTP-binding protein [Deltaproteobacteria bacterium]